MKRYALFLFLITFGYVLGWGGSVLRFGLPHREHREGRGGPFEGLGLNDDQKEQIRKIRREEREQRESLRASVDAARQNFEKTLDSTQDLAQLQSAFDQMLKSKNAMEQAHFQHMMKIHRILTLEQIQKMGERRPPHGRGQRGPGPGPGPDPDRHGHEDEPPPPEE